MVLVTGASGFLAGHCVSEPLEHCDAVRGTVRSVQAHEKHAHPCALANHTGATIELVEADLEGDYICAGDHMWIEDMAKVLAAEFNTKGYWISTGYLPYWLMWIFARFDKTIRLGLEYVGRREQVSCAKAQCELGWSMRPVEHTIIDTGRSTVEYGIVPARRLRTTKPQRADSPPASQQCAP